MTGRIEIAAEIELSWRCDVPKIISPLSAPVQPYENLGSID